MINNMVGGGLKNMYKNLGKEGDINLFLLALFILLLKTIIVQWTYNQIWPKISYNSGNDTSKFSPLTFYEALLFVILIEFLF